LDRFADVDGGAADGDGGVDVSAEFVSECTLLQAVRPASAVAPIDP
jgi:hypothetical protein